MRSKFVASWQTEVDLRWKWRTVWYRGCRGGKQQRGITHFVWCQRRKNGRRLWNGHVILDRGLADPERILLISYSDSVAALPTE